MTNWQRSLALVFGPLVAVATTTAAHAAILLSSSSPRQGETIEVTVSGDGTAGGVKFLEREFKLFPGNAPGEYRALLGIPADLEPGVYKLRVGEDEKTVKVLLGKFPLQYLRLPPGKDNFDMSPGEKDAVEGAKAHLSDVRMWTSAFIKPSKYRTSSLFGLKRVVNGHLLKDYFHSGLDFAAPAGTPVAATSDGVVLLAAKGFKLHGNTVAIDHGQGVVSFYIHLSSILVKKGQVVKAGEKIGTIGSTGRANGPHLHFSIYVNQVATNPMDWFQRAF